MGLYFVLYVIQCIIRQVPPTVYLICWIPLLDDINQHR